MSDGDPWRDYRTDPPGPGSYIVGRYLDSSGAWHEGNLRTCSKRPPCCVTSAEDVAFALWTMRPPEQWRYPDEPALRQDDEQEMAGR